MINAGPMKFWLNAYDIAGTRLQMPYTNECTLLKPLKLNYNTPKPVIKADPNTPLKLN